MNSHFVNTLPDELKTVLATVKKLADGGPNDPTRKETDDAVRLLSLVEVGGTGSDAVNGQGTPYTNFADTSSRIRSVVDSSSPGLYWLRSIRSSSITKDGSFFSIDENGKPTKSSLFTNNHILFGFCT